NRTATRPDEVEMNRAVQIDVHSQKPGTGARFLQESEKIFVCRTKANCLPETSLASRFLFRCKGRSGNRGARTAVSAIQVRQTVTGLFRDLLTRGQSCPRADVPRTVPRTDLSLRF